MSIVGKTKIWPAGGKAGPVQGSQQQIQRLSEAVLVAVHTGAEYLEVDPRATPADTKAEPSTGKLIEQAACSAGATGC
jgi:hypothetical protein